VRERIPLGGRSRDLDSRYGREEVTNCYIETDDNGEWKAIERAPGFTDFIELGDGPIRAMHVAADVLYVVSGSSFYRVTINPVGSVSAVNVGTVAGFTSPARIASIGTDEPQVMALTDGRGFIYKNSDGSFAEVTDIDFDPDFSVTAFNQRFWFNKPDSNEFFGSDILDGFSYDPLFFASAENKPDLLRYVVAVNTEVIPFGSGTRERWQDTGASTGFPLRRTTGGTVERGLGAKSSLTTWQNNIFFLADDFTVHLVNGGNYQKISDLALEEQIRDYSNPERAEGWFIDHPHYKVYCLTFVGSGVTWCYDVNRGNWHKRASNGLGKWRVNNAALIFDRVVLGDSQSGKLFVLDERVFSEAGEETPTIWQTPAISIKSAHFTCSRIELFPEVGVGNENNVTETGQKLNNTEEPGIKLSVSKDGGETFINKTDRSLGRIGNRKQKVIWRNIGRVRRGQGLVFRFTVNDDVRLTVYEAWADIDKGA